MSLAPPTENLVYDIIFAGGGAAACVTAGRLSAADPSLKILIVEAGPHTRGLQEHVQPGRYLNNLVPTSKVFSFHVGQPSEELDGRSPVVPAGRCLGGGSSVNFVMYTRAAASDYDDWETVYGNSGWGSKDLIPLLKKTETYQIKSETNQPTHGHSGPIKVSYGGIFTNVGQQFLEVASGYDKDRGTTDDANDFYSCNAYGRWPKYIDGDSGRRSDTAHHFIYNQDQNKNLQVLTGHQIVRVVFEGNRAAGIEYVNDSISPLEVISARASRLVVISAGAFGSPAILERSGIGAKDILHKNDIDQIVDLPGVGENYNDHNLVFVPFLAGEEAETFDHIYQGNKAEVDQYVTQWTNEGKGLMAHNGIDAGIKFRPNSEDLKELGSAFEKQWREYFANAPDKPVVWIGVLAGYTGGSSAGPYRKYMSLGYYTEYPVSTGRLHITSGHDVHAPLHFVPGYLSDLADVAVLRLAYKRGRELLRRMPLYRGEFQPGNPVFPEGSAAACKEAIGPVDISAPDIVYSADDDKVIDDYHRKVVETTWHSLGTCAMKAREKGGVVDSRLNVYGVHNLKVADISICPGNVGANTYNTALAVGEKAATIIAEDLGITGV